MPEILYLEIQCGLGVTSAKLAINYEAAKRQFEREFPCHCELEFTERGLHASDCVFDESDSVVAIVDAAITGELIE